MIWERLVKCVPLNNRPCQARRPLVNINSNETLFYSFTVTINKSGGSRNTIDYPDVRACFSDRVKNINVKVHNLVSRVNETKSLVGHELCKCKCVLSQSVCNSYQK